MIALRARRYAQLRQRTDAQQDALFTQPLIHTRATILCAPLFISLPPIRHRRMPRLMRRDAGLSVHTPCRRFRCCPPIATPDYARLLRDDTPLLLPLICRCHTIVDISLLPLRQLHYFATLSFHFITPLRYFSPLLPRACAASFIACCCQLCAR